MDNKTWLWRKKSAEKTIPASDKVKQCPKGNEGESLLWDKAELEKELGVANEKLSLALSESNSKDELVEKHANMAQEAIAGWEKAETEALTLRQELDEALQQRVAAEERLAHLDAALRECMQQLRFVREEQEKRIHDAVMKASREFEKLQMVLEEKLAETGKRLAKMDVENAHLGKALLGKEKMIEDLKRQLAGMEADFNSLMSRLESTEKDNASLKYELRVLEKEVEIRNEEREFNRRTADVSHKQHLESVKKIARLESECQRLRLLVRKRLPGPAALVKMKNEVEMLGRDSFEVRRGQMNPRGFVVDTAMDSCVETTNKRISSLTDQLSVLVEENKALKEALNKKSNELQVSRVMHARTASKLPPVESQPEESPKTRRIMELTRSNTTPNELSITSMSDVGSDDKASCAESWASALISELEYFRNEKRRESLSPSSKTVGVLDLDLMDDFAEMEKLANSSAEAVSNSLEFDSNGYSSGKAARKTVPLSDSESDLCVTHPDSISRNRSLSKAPDWLQDVLKVVLEQSHVTKRNPEAVLEDIAVALELQKQNREGSSDAKECSNNPHKILSGSITRKPAHGSLLADSTGRESERVILAEQNSEKQLQSDLSESLSRIVELIEGISLPSPDDDSETLKKNGNLNSEVPTGYLVRVFHWKTSELSAVLKQFIHACHDLLNAKADPCKFVKELTIALEWIMNHCFSLQDVSSIRDSIKKQFDWDESRSESEVESGMIGYPSQLDNLRVPREQFSCLNSAATSGSHIIETQTESNLAEENIKLKEELINTDSAKKDLEGKLQSATDRSESLMNRLQESEKTVTCLRKELETLKESKGVIEEQIESQHIMNQDLDTQLKATRIELNEVRQKLSTVEVELDSKTSCCEELEATCLDLQLQLESSTEKHEPENERSQDEKQLRADWEITAASEKLAECQETILNLGKQLKALAAPREAALFDKVIAAPNSLGASTVSATAATATAASTPAPSEDKNAVHRFSLLDQMLAEDDAAAKRSKPAEVVTVSAYESSPDEPIKRQEKFVNGLTNLDGSSPAIGTLAIVPSKAHGGRSLWRRLLSRKKACKKKTPHPLAS